MCDKSTVSFCTLSITGKHTHFGMFVVTNDYHIKVTWSPKELMYSNTLQYTSYKVDYVKLFMSEQYSTHIIYLYLNVEHVRH